MEKSNDHINNISRKVLDAEKNIGIETFFTSFNGVCGKLRAVPEDFTVYEVSKHPAGNKDGKFVIADITITNWETNHLIRELSKKLHISRKRVSFAGTKDKRAKSTRLMSFYNISRKDLIKIDIKDVEIENIYRSNRPIKIGDLLGNRFEISIRDIEDANEDQLQDVISFIKSNRGFPNFYGIQRFGTIRPITHIVGRNIINDEFENAVMTYVANPMKGEEAGTFRLRKKLEKTRDFSEALESYPRYLNFEKAMLNKLVVDSEDFVGAIKELPKNLLTMFIYAYQSYLFNKILSRRIQRKLPLNAAVIGDIILPVRKDVIEGEISVRESNIEKVNNQIYKGKAFVSAVLFGSDSKFSEGEMGEIEHKIIDEEKIDLRDFIIPDIPYLSSKGSRRPILSNVKDLDFKLIDDDLNKGKLSLKLKFELSKGCYATSLLREFMKTDDIRKY